MQTISKMSAPTAKIVRLGDGASITVLMNGESLTLRASESQEAFDRALSALRSEDWDALYSAMRPVKSFANKVPGVTVAKDKVLWNGEELNNAISTRILDFALAGLDHTPLCKFLAKLMANPSKRAVEELYKFLEHQNLPITDNGNFLAYKGVDNDWYSKTAGTETLIQGKTKSDGYGKTKIFNGVGEVIEMHRRDVDDNASQGCSKGLHAGTEEYAKQFAGTGRMVIVEINPSDVVSIPYDCSFQKLRTCKYKVVSEYTDTLTKPLYDSSWKDDVDDIGDVEVAVVVKQPRDNKGRFMSNKTVTSQPAATTVPVTAPTPTVDTDEEDYLTFETPSSDWIKDVEWFVDNKELVINKYDGYSISHFDVPLSVAKDFEDTVSMGGSAGRYYNQHIKGSY
jgi:hypothetical protein